MYMTPVEVMWRYLHDDTNVVGEWAFVTDPFSYISKFVDMISRNPECLAALKSKMDIERRNSSILGLFLRGGYGMAEMRIMHMMRYEAFREILEREFSWLCNNQDGPKLRR